MKARHDQSDLFQLEVKRYLVDHQFSPLVGWKVTVDVDGMERAISGQQKAGKRGRAACAENWLRRVGVEIGRHSTFGRADLVAKKGKTTVVVEVEGESSKQKSTALYQALGQIILIMSGDADVRYGIAVPDTPIWEDQMMKIPEYVRNRLSLTLWLVSKTGVREL